MIVSHRHRFIFLKTRKTAGTSVEVALSRIAGDDAIVTPISPSGWGHQPRNHEAREKPPKPIQALLDRSERPWQRLVHEIKDNPEYCQCVPYYNHMPAWLVRSKLGSGLWSSYFKFCFERNPWDKVVSIYGWQTRDLQNAPAFCSWLFSSPKVASDWPIYSIAGECAVDAVGQYESLNKDLEVFARHVGIAPGDVDLPRVKSGFRREVHYSLSGADYIRQMFHREIELWDYECPPSLLAQAQTGRIQ